MWFGWCHLAIDHFIEAKARSHSTCSKPSPKEIDSEMFRCECSWKDQVGISTDKTRNKNHWLPLVSFSANKRHERLLLYWFCLHIINNQDISRFSASCYHCEHVNLKRWNRHFSWRFSMDRGIGISHKNAVKQRSFWEFVWWIELASIEIQFWSTEFLEKPPTSLWPPFFSKPCMDIERVKPRFFMVFLSVSQRSQHEFAWDSDVRFWMKRWKMSSGTPCRIELCTVYIPKRRRGSLQTCFILDILWYFLKLFSDFSVKNNWIPIKVLGLRFADFGALPGFCTAKPLPRFETSQENWWFGTWNLEKLWRSWVNFGVDKWHPTTLCMNFGWLAMIGPMEITSVTMEMDQIWPVQMQISTQECGNCERQFLKKSGQLAKRIYAIHINYKCMTYVYHMCIIIWHIYTHMI